jgi:5'-3' exonuclease
VLLAVDGNSLVHRSFHAQAATGSRSRDGRGIWAVRGLIGQLVAAVERIGPDAIVVGFDDPQSSRRRERWPQYKARRVEKLEELVEQLALAVEVLRAMGIAVVMPVGLEADDVLASAARFGADSQARTVIMTSDRDAFSLIDDNTRVLRIINGGVEASPLLTPERLQLLLGVGPGQYRDYAAMRGDASDNLPGVHGIGPKTAAKLLAAFGSARAAFDDIAAGGTRVVEAIGAGAARRLAHPDARVAWELNCAVMAMHDDIGLGLDLDRISDSVGCLPLDPTAIRAAFAPHQPGWTIVDALRVLGGEAPPDSPRSQFGSAAAHRDIERSTSGRPEAARRPIKLPPLPKKIDQLSLFD